MGTRWSAWWAAALLFRLWFFAWLSFGSLLPIAAGTAPSPWGARVLAATVRWDGQLYLDIAQQGYFSPPLHLRAAFFPLWPLVLRALFWLQLGGPPAALFVANGLDLLATAGFRRLAGRLLLPPQATVATLLYVVFPGRLFGCVVGTEGLFAALSLWTFVAAQAGRTKLALLGAALCGACRVQGVFVGLALAMAAAASCQRRGPPPAARAGRGRTQPLVRAAAYLAAAALGPLAFAAHLRALIGRPWAFAEVQGAWGRKGTLPWQSLCAHAELYDILAAWGALLVLLWAAPALWSAARNAKAVARSRPFLRTLWLYCALSLLLPLCTGRLMSMQRFVSVLFALAFFAAEAASQAPRARRTYFAYSLAMTALLAVKLAVGQKVV